LLWLIQPDSRSTAKTSGTKRDMMFRLGVPGGNYILRLTKTIRFWRANSPHRTSATPPPVPDLLDQISTPFETFMADGAYDGEPVSQAVLDKQPDAQVVIPPHKTAFVPRVPTHSETAIFKPLHRRGASRGSAKRAITCAVISSWPCNATNAFSATS